MPTHCGVTTTHGELAVYNHMVNTVVNGYGNSAVERLCRYWWMAMPIIGMIRRRVCAISGRHSVEYRACACMRASEARARTSPPPSRALQPSGGHGADHHDHRVGMPAEAGPAGGGRASWVAFAFRLRSCRVAPKEAKRLTALGVAGGLLGSIASVQG